MAGMCEGGGERRSSAVLLVCSAVCGQRVRVENAKARSVNQRGGPSQGGSRGGE